MKILGTRYSEKRQRNAQDRVKQGYIKRYRLRIQQWEYLHLFFSPWRVPKDLTKDEVLLAIELYPLLGGYRRSTLGVVAEFLGIEPTHYMGSVCNVALPDELVVGGRMTRTRFRVGIRKLLQMIR